MQKETGSLLSEYGWKEEQKEKAKSKSKNILKKMSREIGKR